MMKRENAYLAAAVALGLAAAVVSARGTSTVNPAVPASNAPLASAPVRQNFQAAYNDITNLQRMYAGPSAPALPEVGQFWRNTTSSVSQPIRQWDGTQWVLWGTLHLDTHTFTFSGSLDCGTLPALVGDVTTPGNSCTTTLAQISSGVAALGSILFTAIAAPSTPVAGKSSVWVDATTKRLRNIDDGGFIGTTVIADAGLANNFLTAISAGGVISKARPTCANLSDGSGGCSMSTTAGGDLSGTLPSPTVARINGVTLGTVTATDKRILIADGSQWTSKDVSGDITISNTGVVAVVNLPSGVPASGSVLFTAIAAPGTPAAGKASIYVDSTNKVLSIKNDAGVVSSTVQPLVATANNFMTGISALGAITRAQPSFSDISSTVACSQLPALTGDVTTTSLCAATIANNAVTFAKMQTIATDRLVGRDTAGTGVPEQISVGGGIEFTGGPGIQTGAFTGDVTKSAGGTALTIAGHAVTNAMFRASAARSVVGVTGNVGADVADIVGTTDQVLRVDNAGTALAFGSIDLSKAAAVGSSQLALGNLANQAQATVVGRAVAAGTGVPSALTQLQLTAMVNVATATLSGALPAWPNNITTFLRGDGTYTAVGLPALATQNNNTVVGNVSGGVAAPIALTATQATTLCNAFTSMLSGCVPASGGGMTTFLRADGAFTTPAGAGDVVGSASSIVGDLAVYSSTTGKAIADGGPPGVRNPVVNPEGLIWQLQNTGAAVVANSDYVFDQWLAQASSKTTVSAGANNGAGLIRLTVASTAQMTTGQLVNVSGIVWNPTTVTINGTWIVTVIDGTHIDLQSSAFSGTYTSGGVAFPRGITASQQVNQEDGTPYNMRLTQAATASQQIGLAQPIEAVNVIGWRSLLIAMSARVRTSAATTLCYAVLSWTSTADVPTRDPINAFSTCGATTFTSGYTVCGSVGSQALGAATFTTVSLTCTPGNTMSNLVVVFWTNTAQATSATMDITKVNIAPGAQAGPYERLPFAMELARAQRYYQKSYDIGVAPGTAGQANGLKVVATGKDTVAYGQVYASMPFQVIMRSPPTITTWSYNGLGNAVTRGDDTTADLSAKTGTPIWSGQSGFAVADYCQPVSAGGTDTCTNVTAGVYFNVFFHFAASATLN